MKYLKLICLAMMGMMVFSCQDYDNDDLVTSEAAEGGLLNAQDPLISHVQGSGAIYDLSVQVFQGAITTGKIDVYKSFTSRIMGTPTSSDRVLLKTIDVTDQTKVTYPSFSVSYDELISGLTFQGNALPADDQDLKVGDFFTLDYVSHTSEGKQHLNQSTSKIAISGRLAGIYELTQGWYIHPSTAPGLASDYTGSYFRVVESIDDITYRMSDIGPWENTDQNFFYFTVATDGTLSIPEEFEGVAQILWGADPIATCEFTPSELPDVSCANFVDFKADKKDVISVSYGYIRASGTRQFDDILTKI